MNVETFNIHQLINIGAALLLLLLALRSMIWPAAGLHALRFDKVDEEGQREAVDIRRRAAGRSAVLALFAVGLGPAWSLAWVMLGALYAGAALGRLLSFPPPRAQAFGAWVSLFFEIAIAAWLIGANLRDALLP